MKIHLGTVDLPEGVLVILDPGLANFWRHAGDPASPRRRAPRCYDIQISEPDAEAAGVKWDREFNPVVLYDVENPGKAIAQFAEFARAEGLDAKASVLPERVPHTERLRAAFEVGGGLGVVTYNGLWCVAVAQQSGADQLADASVGRRCGRDLDRRYTSDRVRQRWGDGLFAVTRSLDARGRLVRVQVELGTEKRQPSCAAFSFVVDDSPAPTE